MGNELLLRGVSIHREGEEGETGEGENSVAESTETTEMLEIGEGRRVLAEEGIEVVLTTETRGVNEAVLEDEARLEKSEEE